MIINNFKIGSRNLRKNKLFSLINIVSLAIGFSASFVIGLMVYYDLTFDTFHKDGDYIYRVTTKYKTPEGEFQNSGVSVPLKLEFKQGVTGVDVATSLFTSELIKVLNVEDNKEFRNPDHTTFTDPEYFKIFDYEWISGNMDNALKNPGEVVLTKSRAEKYFPNIPMNDIIGKTLVYNDSVPVSVVGIVTNFKERTDLTFEEFISMETAKQTDMVTGAFDTNWDNTSSSSQLFIKINPKTGMAVVKSQLDKIASRHRSDFEVQFSQSRDFELQPLSDLHFSQNLGIFNYSHRPASKSVMMGLGFVAVFLLLLGCINFINLNTAQANHRAKEIGIRKTLGSSKKQLIFQFLGETFLLTIASALLSIVFAFYLLKVFADFTPPGLEFSLFKDPLIIGFSIILILIVTLLSGLYPALVLTHFKPVSVLKNQVLNKNSKPTLRRFLTVFQFSIAQIFIIATLLVGKQIKFMLNKDMGFKTDAIVYLQTPWHEESLDKRLRLTNEIKKLPKISKITLCSNPPASNSQNTTIATFKNGDVEIHTSLQMLYADTNYLRLYGIEVIAGRDRLNDTIKELVINESYLNNIGFKNPDDAIGKQIEKGEGEFYPIVGVVKNFNQRSLKSKIEPMAITGDIYRNEFSSFRTISMGLADINSEDLKNTITDIEKNFKSIYPDSDFKLKFMDETVENFYLQEKSLSKLLNWAMGLSVLISCLGLFGLVIFTTERRTKEIGIRKVLGASVMDLNVLLCKDFLILVGIAFLIAAPLAWLGLHNWLQEFAFKTQLSWWIFAISGLGMIIIALLIMGLKTVSTASKNPVNSLRTE